MKSKEVSQRLKSLIDRKYPSRGRFGVLASTSAITEARWRNFYYGKQEAALDMIDFWCKAFPDEKSWLLQGDDPDDKSNYPFHAGRIPVSRDEQTVAERLTWVIFEWASPTGEKLFQYLEEKADGQIKANEWAKVILGGEQPRLEMVILVGTYRPHFTEWILYGIVRSNSQVDPTDMTSVRRWIESEKEAQNKLYEYLRNDV
ncbi:hypothetical protein VA599_06060 [Chromobacterium sp. TRC.1.1.SA]|uniref:Uncharacterized protein n=1 Tax=Chromobacterium indicum TaxID=3110228 RepID=A0ABV0CJX7_9NEIS